jgi:NAD(P)-dependent dehydrogenase (short-subunit alcohol dehydrogenase family)
VNALITGASRGIGRAIAVELSRTHRVLGTWRGSAEAAESLARECGCEMARSDISSAADRADLIDLARRRFPDGLDLLVNNAGIAPRERRDVLEATEESFHELIATNLEGPHFLTQLAARWMLERRMPERQSPRIVFISSISAFAASVNRAEYCVAKAGLSMSRMVYAERLAPEGIPVFEIQPGIVRTDMIAKVEKAYEERIAAGLLPQRRMGTPEDIASVVRAIADGRLDYCAGQVIHADGGFHLRSL